MRNLSCCGAALIVAAGRRPGADRGAGRPCGLEYAGHEELDETHFGGVIAFEEMPLAVGVPDEVALAHTERLFVGPRRAGAGQHIHEMLGAFVMMVRRLGARGVDDHLALDRLGAKQLGRGDINAFTRIVFGVEHGLARPVDDTKTWRACREGRVKARGIRYGGMYQRHARVGGERADETRRQKHDMRMCERVCYVAMRQRGLSFEDLYPCQITRCDVERMPLGGCDLDAIQQHFAALGVLFCQQALASDACGEGVGFDGAFVDGERHECSPCGV